MTTTLIAVTRHSRRRLHVFAAGRWVGAIVAVAMTAAGLQAAGAGPASAAGAAGAGKGAEPAPVSNAFAMGGGIGGQVDPRTGAFQAQLPLVNVAGRAGTGLSLALSYDQSMAAQNIDRFGLGAGWSLGVPWVNTAGGVRVYPASGGSYAYDSGSPTGLAQYPLRDLTFAKDPGTIPARPGTAAQPYVYVLTYLDGTVDRFDYAGNLVEQADRFGNPIDLAWRQSGSLWQLTSVTDSYGQAYTFDYSTPGQVKVISPVNAEKITATLTLHISNGRLAEVSAPLNQNTFFYYNPVKYLPAELLSSVISPTGEQTDISYTSLEYDQGVAVVNTVTVKDPAGRQVLAQRTFRLDPNGAAGSADRHNYTGYPEFNKAGSDGLFTDAASSYSYSTSLSDGASTVVSTYNYLHLLVSRQVSIAVPSGTRLDQAQTYAYPPVNSVAHLPPNYAKPVTVTVVYGDQQFENTRPVVTTSAYDDRGQQTSFTNAAGTTTTTTYDPRYGLPLTQTVTGADRATSVTTNTLTDDGKEVKTATTAVGATAATAKARTVATYNYNGFGQVSGESLTWAPGAKPAGDSGGPDQIDDTQQISVDTAAHTQTGTVTAAAGTPQAASTTTVTDLVTGNVLSQTNPDHLTTSYTYDALGRQLTQTVPGGLTTTTFYNSPTVTTVTAPSGLETQTTTDVTGRTVKVTDNVSGEQLVADPAARTVETDHYAPDGSQVSTTTPAGTTTTSFDPLGRPVSVVHPGGITQTDKYNDAANTQIVSLLAAGAKASDPTAVTTEVFNNLNQPLTAATSYPDNTPQAPAAESYDGLGRVSSYTADNITATPDYGGAGGLQTGTTLTPADTGAFPGQPVTAGTGNTMTGSLTAKTLTAQSKGTKGAAAPVAGTTYTYNNAGQVATATDPAGHTTSYTYTAAGQVATVTQPDGTVTSYTYDPVTGRLTGKKIRNASGTATQDTGYTYYPATGLVASVYNPADKADAISYHYDADGHLIQADYPDGTSTKASYDDNGNLATTTDITGAVTTYTYNPAAGQPGGCGPTVTNLCSAVQKRGDTTLASVSYTYDSLDRIHTITRANKVTTTLDYTDASQVKTETTAAAYGSLLRRDDYTYDSHGNVATHTITTALPSPAAPAGQAGAARRAGPRQAAGQPVTTITAYGYDAYNRLISSAAYPGDKAVGTPASTTTYTVDTAGDVTGQDTTAGTATTHIVNTIDGGRLTARTTDGGKPAEQKFDDNGNVTTSLAGDTYTYTLAGQIATVTTPAGIITRYAYWPDGTRRSATTTAGGVDHVITYHYTTSGKIANDTYTGAAAGAAGPDTVTASYLLAANREARTLLATTGTGGTGIVQASGPGTGYYLTDAHGSVTAVLDASGQPTATYAYTDYGQPVGASPALLPTPAADPADNAAVNPFTYDGAYTNPTTGTQYLPARSYDPAQGRFLSEDAGDQINRYQAFDTNPVTNTDPTGQWAVPQIVTDVFAAALFLVFGGLSAGAAVPVLAAVVTGAEEASAITVSVVANAVSAAANLGAAATSGVLVADDAAELAGNGFLTDSQKENLTTANTFLGTIAGGTGALAGFAEAGESAEQVAASSGGESAAESEWEAPQSVTDPPSVTDLAASTTSAPPITPGTDIAAATVAPDAGGVAFSDKEAAALTKVRGLYDDPADNGADWGDIPEVAVAGNGLNAPAAAPDSPDPAAPQLAAVEKQAGQDANLNPVVQPAFTIDAVPDNPLQTSPVTEAVTPVLPPTATGSPLSITNPFAEVTATGIDQGLNGNTEATAPGQPPDPLNSNNSPSVLTENYFETGWLGGGLWYTIEGVIQPGGF